MYPALRPRCLAEWHTASDTIAKRDVSKNKDRDFGSKLYGEGSRHAFDVCLCHTVSDLDQQEHRGVPARADGCL